MLKKVWLAENYIRGENMLYKASQALRDKMVIVSCVYIALLSGGQNNSLLQTSR